MGGKHAVGVSADTDDTLDTSSSFLDIDLDTSNINTTKSEAAITERHSLLAIVGTAQSSGGGYTGRKSCGTTPRGATSFFPSTPLSGSGDNGFVTHWSSTYARFLTTAKNRVTTTSSST